MYLQALSSLLSHDQNNDPRFSTRNTRHAIHRADRLDLENEVGSGRTSKCSTERVMLAL